MKKIILFCLVILIALTACTDSPIAEPVQCSLCDGLPIHAPCIINLSTGEMLPLEVYEPHPFLVGELAEDQRQGYFSLIHSAGVEGYKLGAERLVVAIPTKSDKLNRQYFCNGCRELLADYSDSGYVLADLKNINDPVIYRISSDTAFSFRCYNIKIQKLTAEGKYEITVIGTLGDNNQ